MTVTKRAMNEFLVNLDKKEEDSLKEQAGKEEQPMAEVFKDIINVGWIQVLSDAEGD